MANDRPTPLESLSRRCEHRTPLQRGPSYPTTVSDRTIGGPGDPADRRLVLDTATLQHLLEIAESSATRRVVVPQVGLRVQVLDNGAHRWEHCYIIGGKARPEADADSPVRIDLRGG